VLHGMWHYQAAGATGGQTGYLSRHPQRGTSRHTCYEAHADCTFCVEGRGQRLGSHVPGVPAMPEGQGSQATSSSCAGHSCACTQVLPRGGGLVKGGGGGTLCKYTSLFNRPESHTKSRQNILVSIR
jgi:hypothetical protein